MPSIKDPGIVPKEGWQYPNFDTTKPNKTARNWHYLYAVVKENFTANGAEPPTKEEVADWCCRNLTVPCFDGNQEFQNKWTNPPTYIKRGKSVEWPLILRPFKLMAKEGDRGLGDIIARTIGPIGGDAYKKWYKTIYGKSCGCSERQETLNWEYPT